MKTMTTTTTALSSRMAVLHLLSMLSIPSLIIQHVQVVHGVADISDCGSPNDPCMNDGNYNQCIELIEVEGCQQLFVMESCPLQFGCGDDETEPPPSPTPPTNPCGSPTDPCMNDENYNECVEIVEGGCQQVFVMESCPLQFGCGDNSDGGDTDPPPSPPDDIDVSSVCGTPTDPCMNDVNYKECIELVENGCLDIISMDSCPYGFACGSSVIPPEPDDTTNTTSISSNYDFCDNLLKSDSACMNDENHKKCVEQIDQGCQNVAVLESCPLQFGCDDDTTSGTPPDDVPSSTNSTSDTTNSTHFCDDLFTIEPSCMTNENYMVCQDLIVNQKCHDVAILKSCPLQFACNDEDFYNATNSSSSSPIENLNGDGGSTTDGDVDGDGSGGEVSSSTDSGTVSTKAAKGTSFVTMCAVILSSMVVAYGL